MALPKISQPIFTLVMPSTGKKTKYRQFTVKEEKILLTAQASGEKADMIEAFKQLIRNCCLDEELDVEAMPAFDVEYFFLQLRAKSVSNVIKLHFESGVDTGKKTEVEIKLDDLQVHKPSVDKKIILDEESDIGVVLRYPTFSMIEKLADADGVESSLGLFKAIIEFIFDADSVYPTADANPQELEEFILSLNNLQVSKIQAFLEDMPYVYIDVEYTLDGVVRKERVRGIENFFA